MSDTDDRAEPQGKTMSYAATLQGQTEIARKMNEQRMLLRRVWGSDYERKIGKLCAAVRKIAKGTGREPFKAALDEALNAGKKGNEVVALQLTAAACELAESTEQDQGRRNRALRR